MKANTKAKLSFLGRASLQAAFVTLLAFLLSMLIMEPLSFSAMSIFSAPEKSDFKITDLYAQVADRRPMRTLDPDIVIVDIDRSDRQQIAGLIHQINLWSPRVIGLDVMFASPTPNDSLLLSAIAQADNIILPIALESNDGKTFHTAIRPFTTSIPDLGAKYAAVNLPGEYEGATIREFATGFPTAGNDSIDSFPLALAKAYAPQSENAIKRRNNRYETIDYPSREFTILNPDNLEDNGELLTDKIVIVGAMSDASDMHSTPINSYMSGMMIHAAATSTILGSRYYEPFNRFPDWLPAFLLCFLILLVRELTMVRMRGLLTRLLQLIIIYLAVRIGYSLYVDHHVIFNFSYTMLMVTFGLFAADIWSGIQYLFGNASRFLRSSFFKLKSLCVQSNS